MGTKLLLVGILIVSSVTTAYGDVFVVGTTNGAAYSLGGPPASSSNYAAFTSGGAGGYVNQQATAFVPWGIGVVAQAAGAIGGQASAPGVQMQGVYAAMGQTAAKAGGGGYVQGTQTGAVGMTQTSPGGAATQSMHATGMQMSAVYGGLGGTGSSSQSMQVGTLQIQAH
jgi:hypothetical protein